MKPTLSLLSPAKLNLFLHITGRRPDGYHELQTLFQLLDWGDQLCFTPNNEAVVTLEGPELGIPLQDNLIYRAAQLLRHGSLGAHITLDKRIPTGGGLGGGSSNAATTLLALNSLWGLKIPRQELQALGASLGADVPVFVAGHTAWAQGIGELLTPVDLPERWYLVIAPDCHISTAKLFSHRQLTRNTSPIKMATFFEGQSRNDFQQLASSLYPEVNEALNWLGNFGEARLTGTGACVFASFDTEAEAGIVIGQLQHQWTAFTARGLNMSPVLTALS